ncbi:PREDICTED: uncharacterized protein LOC108556411 [Nicrophorus vespilloides]|uniref:Uncharacterized protein LOC108556411 n=1 Tax=Nicrophorus vespilloides TaxID=110193 RepID=A0ABM1M0C1_NICVS|nr:PREDICTED: uncharacterized protein LOC108556411 [Nicrophorus vespilloides]
MADTVWTYYTKEKGGEKARCLICENKLLSCKGSSTSGLIRHLHHVHKINVLKRNVNDNQVAGSSNTRKVPTTITKQPLISFVMTQRHSLSEIVARLASVDGFSINGISKSEFIRQALSDRQCILPNDKNDIKKLIYEFHEFAKCEIVGKIKSHKEKCGKFSLTLNEWKSSRNRRYLNINIHFNKQYINLGVLRMVESSTAIKIIDLVNSKLSEFGIHLSDVVASTTDGAAVMLKFGGLSQYIHQICYNHGIHLAVADIIYNKNKKYSINQNDITENEYSSTEDDFFESDDETDNEEPDNAVSHKRTVDDIKPALQMVRRIVKFFKIAPNRNSILQNHVKEMHGLEMSLILDCKTRWKSIVTMTERFLKIVDSVRNALRDLSSLHLLNDDNIPILWNICNALKPIKLAVEALSRHDANLVTADAILKFLFDSLRENDDNISYELLEVLLYHVKERRNQDLVSLAKFLQTLDLQSTATYDLPSSSKSAIIHYASELFNRLFEHEVECDDMVKIEVQSDDSFGEENEQHLDIHDRLADAINAALKTKKIETKDLQKELQIYESTGNITKNLQNLLDSLMTIRPTSIQSVRVLSLSDFSIDCLTFLKCYFLNK